MTQKVLKVGDSAAVTIPKKSLKELGLKIGDEIYVEVDRKEKAVHIKPAGALADKALMEWTKKFIKRYKLALKALANK